MNNYPEWSIKNKVGYSLVLGDKEGHVMIVHHNGQNFTRPITEEEAKAILAGESDGFGKWIMSEDLLGKQVKIKGSFPYHSGVIVGSYPAGWNHPEELFIVSLLDNSGNHTDLTRSEFELL
jgi:hypothetical protein